jgi:COP9 signalosome complex subunit 4
MTVGRRVLGALVSALSGGVSLARKSSSDDAEEEGKWLQIGSEVFSGEKGNEIRGEVVDGILESEGMAGWCEEQVSRPSVTE